MFNPLRLTGTDPLSQACCSLLIRLLRPIGLSCLDQFLNEWHEMKSVLLQAMRQRDIMQGLRDGIPIALGY